MNATSTRITLVCRGQRRDVAAHSGLSVAELLASQGVGHHRERQVVTTMDGEVVSAEAIVGEEITEGALLMVTSQDARTRSALNSAPSVESVLRSSVGEASVLLLAALCFILGGMRPLLGQSQLLPLAARVSEATLMILLVLGAALRRPESRSALREALLAVILPAAGGVAASLMVPQVSPDIETLTGLALLWGSAAAALIIWAMRKERVVAIAAGAWVSYASLLTVVFIFQLRWSAVLPPLMAVGGLGGLLVSRLAVRVQDNQLLDMTRFTSLGRSIRHPVVAPASRASQREVVRSVREVEVLSLAWEIVFAVTILLAAPAVVDIGSGTDVSSWNRFAIVWAARIEFVGVIALLLLRPRYSRYRALRIIPRVVALAVIVGAILSVYLGVYSELVMHGEAVIVMLFVAGVGVSVLGALLPLTSSALWGRIADVVQFFAALLTLPAAILAAGLFDTMRQW